MQSTNANLRNFIQINRIYIKETEELRLETVTSIYI